MLQRGRPIAPVPRSEPTLVPEGEKCVHILIALSNDISPTAAIASIRASTRHKLLTPTTNGPVAAVTATDVDNYFIYHQILIDNNDNNKGVNNGDRSDAIH